MGENGKIPFRMIASVWWLIMWRYMAGTLILSVVFGAIGGVVAAYLGLNPHNPHDQIRVFEFALAGAIPVTAAYVRRDRSQRREPIVS
jgi:hypothetical protein